MDASRKPQVSLRGASAKEISRDALLERVSQERELWNYVRRATSAAIFIQVACDMPLWATFGGQDDDRLPSASTCYNTLTVLSLGMPLGIVLDHAPNLQEIKHDEIKATICIQF